MYVSCIIYIFLCAKDCLLVLSLFQKKYTRVCAHTQIYRITQIYTSKLHEILERLEHVLLIFMGCDLEYINKNRLHKIRKTGEEEKL